MGSGVVGALAYTWSDTFWFSAEEGEVYAYYQNKKNFNVNNKSFKKDQNLKNNKLSQLDKEIERNWKILGRDRNGNILKKYKKEK